MSTANPDTLIGRLIDGRYQVRSLIARGGMATVYVATDLRLERRIAIKIMHDHLAADDAFRERFIREAKAAARLAHPNLVNVYDQGEDEGLAYIAMEYVPGITLRDLLHDHHRLTVEQTIDIMDAVLAGLQVAHRHGIIHRDIKPENVLLADDGRIKLSDFGLARAVTSNTATGSVLLGTIAYLAPELVTQGSADVRSDIYSAGIMMYEMLVGEQPYRSEEPVNIAYRHANDNVPPPSEKVASLPRELDDLVVWATERDPEDRPADAGAMLAALRQAERDALSGDTASGPVGVVHDAPPTATLLTGSSNEAKWENLTTPTDPSTVEAVLGEWQEQPSVAPLTAQPPAPGATPAAATRLGKVNAQKRRSGFVAALVVAALIVVAAGIGWWQGFGPGSYDMAPDVVGLTQEEAESQILAYGYVVGEVLEENSLDVPVGTVMDMDPGAGSSLAPDSAITLTISAGPRILTVPALVGKPLADAEAAIEQAEFTYDAATNLIEFSTEPKDTVLQALTENGEELPFEMAEYEPIRLVVSAGPVPDVTGTSESDAMSALAAVGLEGEVVASDYSDTVPEGAILWQEDTADPMRPGDTVNMSVSLGIELVDVPNVANTTVAAARAELEALGLKVELEGGATIDEAKHTVNSQSVASGERVAVDTVITLGYRSGTPTTSTPTPTP